MNTSRGSAHLPIHATGQLRGHALKEDYHFWETDILMNPAFPQAHFIEKKYSGDITNWWMPNRACSEAMLRSAGFDIIEHPEEEVYICRARN